ncbi:hypothetical protein HXX76_013169 [Chlamydomonas incerta]|uniref:ATPase n=1 Tax=Chlamydomonas incerta TaxID=51695 RepID=A0A835SFC5_CHLIN|nr:hypothetical protein HXX76_013169 [Chlamydomonas incerta]|eukprot:KAG2426188.1 hypothetical protein HXX76_013169 [Chlamydomonas incerta]
MLVCARSLRRASRLAGAAWPAEHPGALPAALGLLDPTGAEALCGHPSPATASSFSPSQHTRPLAAYSSQAAAANSTCSTGAASEASSSPNPVLHKYRALLADGTLKPDEQQAAFVQRLGRLYDEVVDYRRRMDEHAAATADFQARRLQRLQQLLAAEEAEEAMQRREHEEQPDHPERCRAAAAGAGASAAGGGGASTSASSAAAAPASGASSVLGWVQAAVASFLPGSSSSSGGDGSSSGSRAAGGGSGGANSARERARRAAVAREERLQREMGPPPVAPTPPRGLYVWGSVGSGKSMLASLLYQALQEGGGLGALRWSHFNSLMLEVHGRLHALDSARWKAAAARDKAAAARLAAPPVAAAAAAAVVAAAGGGGAEGDVSARGARGHLAVAAAAALRERAAALGAAGGDAYPGAQEDDEEEEEGQEDEGADSLGPEAMAAAAAGGHVGEVPLSRQGVMRHWDPRRDPEVRRQREARAAMLAVRRHMRLARLGRTDPRSLAAANAAQLTHMAAALIRGRAGDPHSGWAEAAAAEAVAARSGAGGGGGGAAPIASALFFDEVQVTDVFSAVALKGLVEALSGAGCVLVGTSNRAPEHLPRHGLHEAMWGHFVDTLLQRCEVVELSSPADYRRVLLEQGRAAIAAAAAGGSDNTATAAATAATAAAAWPPVCHSYLHPAGPGATAEMERLWRAFVANGAAAGGAAAAAGAATAGGAEADSMLDIPVLFGRRLGVRRPSPCGGGAWFSFAELCAAPLGAADYTAVAGRFHTLFIEGVPAMSMQVRDQARRFITLVDELYGAKCVLVASAEVPPEQLFLGAEGEEPILDVEGLQFETAAEDARLRRDVMATGAVAPVAAGGAAALAAAAGALGGAEERFAFRRAVSRLLEMQSPAYISAAARLRQGQGLQQQGLQQQGLQQEVRWVQGAQHGVQAAQRQ